MKYFIPKKQVTRLAILIGSPSKGSRFLPGVRQDLENLRRFLKSDNGGRWRDEEILILSNPYIKTVLQHLHSSIADYTIVYFSGHGGTTQEEQRILELRDGFLADADLLNESPRQAVICDSCSNYIRPGISGIPEYQEQYFNYDGVYQARELFDQYILNSPHGKIIVHSSEVGHPSYDGIDGGFFTNALLNVATKLKTYNNYQPLTLSNILDYVPDYLRRKGYNQTPTSYSEGRLSVPFAFGFQRVPFSIQHLDANNVARNQTVSNGDWGFLFGFGLFLLAASASGK